MKRCAYVIEAAAWIYESTLVRDSFSAALLVNGISAKNRPSSGNPVAALNFFKINRLKIRGSKRRGSVAVSSDYALTMCVNIHLLPACKTDKRNAARFGKFYCHRRGRRNGNDDSDIGHRRLVYQLV